jgi:hypothetical protein
MTEAERQGRVRVCEHCHRTWIAFGLRGERCVWCLPSIPEDVQLAFSDTELGEEPSHGPV